MLCLSWGSGSPPTWDGEAHLSCDPTLLLMIMMIKAPLLIFMRDVWTMEYADMPNWSFHQLLKKNHISLCCANEELASICVSAWVCHRKCSEARVLKFEVLVSELSSVNRLSSGAIILRKISALAHKFWNDTVERRAVKKNKEEGKCWKQTSNWIKFSGGVGNDLNAKCLELSSLGNLVTFEYYVTLILKWHSSIDCTWVVANIIRDILT